MNALSNIRMVSASAGTGKTYYLTQVIAEQIASGTPASAVMATTFTKKAAGELRERIAGRLLDGMPDAAEPARLQEAAQQLPVSLVGTVNSVCGRLLQEYALDAGLSPALDVIAEDEQAGIFRRATDAVLASYAARILPIAHRLSQLDDDGGWDSTVRTICDAARNNQLSGQDLQDCAERSWTGFRELLEEPAVADARPTWLHRFRQALSELITVAESGVDASGKPVNITAIGFTKTYPVIRRNITALDTVEKISWEQWRGVIPSSNTPAWVRRQFEGPVTAVREELLSCPVFHDDVEQYIRLIFSCAADCLSAFAEFKQAHGLIDFTDQETLVVELARDNAAFRASFRSRVKFLVVDEFQDTSPIQLELFLQLSRLVEKVVWVGDPKQSIFEFRGTDPELMSAVVTNVNDVDRLDKSWRSQQAVLDLSNGVFVPVFERAGMPRESMEISIPPERAQMPRGTVEAWTRTSTRKEQRCSATAAGVADLLRRRPELKPSDIAVLVRTHAEAADVSKALVSAGIRASANEQSLLASREVQLVRAAMAYIADERDTVALTELVALSPLHSGYQGWQASLLEAAEPSELLTQWAEDPLIAALGAIRDRAASATPAEVLEEAVGLLCLPRLIKTWSAPDSRLRNLDALRGQVDRYYVSCQALRAPGTLRGFLRYLTEEEQRGAENSGDDVVQVLTYHSAKGLEWPVVVLESLDSGRDASVFGTSVEPAREFDVSRPLADRWIRFWPKVFPYGGSPLDTAAQQSPLHVAAETRGRNNAARLLYVGMTRAAETTVLTSKTSSPSALNELGIENLLSWSGTEDDGAIDIAGRGEPLPAKVYSYEPVDAAAPAGQAGPVQFLDEFPAQRPAVEHVPARIRASGQQLTGEAAEVIEIAALGDRLIPHGDQGWDAVGSAIHAYLGTSYEALMSDDQLSLAKQIIDRWEVGDLVSSEILTTSGDRLTSFLAARYPGAHQYREVPIAWRNHADQVMEGWIDLLLETPDGYILVDHKSYPGTEPVQHIQENNLGQMNAYEQAIRAATGKPVVQTLIHLPALGKVCEIVYSSSS